MDWGKTKDHIRLKFFALLTHASKFWIDKICFSKKSLSGCKSASERRQVEVNNGRVSTFEKKYHILFLWLKVISSFRNHAITSTLHRNYLLLFMIRELGLLRINL